MVAAEMVPETVSLDVTTGIEPDPTPGWVPAPTVGPDMVTICREGGPKSNEELDELGEESAWGLIGL